MLIGFRHAAGVRKLSTSSVQQGAVEGGRRARWRSPSSLVLRRMLRLRAIRDLTRSLRVCGSHCDRCVLVGSVFPAPARWQAAQRCAQLLRTHLQPLCTGGWAARFSNGFVAVQTARQLARARGVYHFCSPARMARPNDSRDIVKIGNLCEQEVSTWQGRASVRSDHGSSAAIIV